MRNFLLLLLSFTPLSAFADVTCAGIPSAVYTGIHGSSPNGETYWVSIPEKGTLPLGLISEDKAKARFSLATTAFVAKKRLALKYYSHTSCEQAAADRATPTYAAISE